jgi:hypothetical protein
MAHLDTSYGTLRSLDTCGTRTHMSHGTKVLPWTKVLPNHKGPTKGPTTKVLPNHKGPTKGPTTKVTKVLPKVLPQRSYQTTKVLPKVLPQRSYQTTKVLPCTICHMAQRSYHICHMATYTKVLPWSQCIDTVSPTLCGIMSETVRQQTRTHARRQNARTHAHTHTNTRTQTHANTHTLVTCNGRRFPRSNPTLPPMTAFIFWYRYAIPKYSRTQATNHTS